MSSTPPRIVAPSTLAAQGRADRRLRLRRAFLATLVLIAMVVPPAVWLAVARGTSPGDGTMTYPSEWSAGGVGLLESEGVTRAATPTCNDFLQAGDFVTGVDGRNLEAWATGSVGLPAPEGATRYR